MNPSQPFGFGRFLLRFSPRLAALITFGLSLIWTLAVVAILDSLRLESARAKAINAASNRANELKLSMERAASATYALAALVERSGGLISDFDDFAKALMPSFPGATGMAVVPNGVVAQICCYFDTKPLIGSDLFSDPQQQVDSKQSRDSGELTLVGPISFPGGRTGLVARLPIFQEDGDKREFWGFVDVGMRLDGILAAARLVERSDEQYQFLLWRNSSGDGSRQIIARSGERPLRNPVRQAVPMFNSDWQLELEPVGGWHNPLLLLVNSALAVIASGLFAFLALLSMQLKRQGVGLQAQVHAGEAKVDTAHQQLKATFDSMPDLAWLKDEQGVYLNCNSRMEALFGRPKSEILGHTDYDLVDRELADFFRVHDLKAIAAGSPQINEEWLTFAGEEFYGLFETIKTPLRDADGRLIGVLGVDRNITEHKRRAEALAESELRLRVTLESTRIGIWDWDLENDIWTASAAYFNILGLEPVEGPADRQKVLASVHPDDRPILVECLQNALGKTVSSYEYEARFLHADGQYRWLGVRGQVVERSAEGLPTRLVGVRIDIDALKRAEEKVHWLAHYDALTGLPNRILLHKKVSSAIAEQRLVKGSLALMFIDLDQFKNVNDSLGHSVGDALLQAVAERMRKLVGEAGTVSRQGGDEFVVLLPGACAHQAGAVAEQLLEVLGSPYAIGQYELVITPSLGISLFPDDGDDFDTLLKCADVAMYEAKHAGRNNYQFFTRDMQALVARKALLESELRRALARNELALAYQPKVELASGRVVGAEALLRWHNGELGTVSPAEFIPIAEDCGLILEIGEWVIATAVSQMRAWLDAGLALETIAVNLSAVQFRHPNLLGRVTALLQAAALPAHYLELELTERVAMNDPEQAMAIMRQLSGSGVRLSIDDFGTGYSSLNYLKRFDIYKLKIDRSFVRSLPGDAHDAAIVTTIIDLAKNLGLKTVAEGVESAAQLDFLRAQGCDQVQGFIYSPAVAAEQFSELLAEIEDA
ncbi:EAL domain-containing protein [Halioxenophilus sp. WMMB6]|uniref:bifunctional diguanylate cyclase/phosphodiesterase n=1 Tax=Halioxenophilus sp. WMMB6 TaxID=3073815 RepID=UPI00295F3F18|nr:EAL domain-containing protein [Halioxenophilus sp. WMMB6]